MRTVLLTQRGRRMVQSGMALFLLACLPGVGMSTDVRAEQGNLAVQVAQASNPCATKAANPCAAKQAPANPCATKAANPCAAKQAPANPCATKAANPCAAKQAPANPCALKK